MDGIAQTPAPPEAQPVAMGHPLWPAITAFPLDDATADMAFTARLARDHAWTPDYAARVVQEYRRFVFLMATAGVEVTPSEDVDEALHLHLSYTRSYWEGLCKAVGKPLHHTPTKGGADEAERFRAAYAETLRRYRAAFGAGAPPDIWPEPAARFDRAMQYRTVRLGRHWTFRRLWSDATSKTLGQLLVVGSVGGGMAAVQFGFYLPAVIIPVVAFAMITVTASGHPWSWYAPLDGSGYGKPKGERDRADDGNGGGCGG